MAETIKGITVTIGAETTGLSAALSDVNKKSRDIQSELKQVEKLLKLDPTNTELLAQKQKLLGDAINNTKEKLDRLRAAQDQVNQQFAEGKISEGQYRAFQREIVKTEQDLAQFEDRLKQTGESADSFGDKLAQAGDKMKGIGKTMSTAVTAPLAAAGALLFKSASDAQNAQGKLQASLGLTSEQAKKLGEVARQVWKEGFGESIDEVNQAIIAIRQTMSGVAEKDLAAIAKGALTISQVFGQDVTEVTAAASVMMKNFGISGKEALDIITVGFQKGGDFSGELLDTLREYAPQFKSLGLSADQAMAMLVAGVQAGAWSLDKVGDAMKEFNLRAQDGSKTTAEGFAAIGLNADQMSAAVAKGGESAQRAFLATVTALANMKDPLQQNLAGVALFGTQWEDVRQNVIIALADGKKGLGDFKGATDEATKAVQENNPMLAITKATRELQDAIGPALLPIANAISNTIAPAVKGMAEAFAALSPTAQQVVIAIAGIIAVIGPLLVIIGSIASAVTTLIGVFTAVSGAITAAGGVMAVITGPIGIAVAAIAGLIAIGVALWKNWDDIKAKAKALGDDLKQKWDGIKTAITTKTQEILSDAQAKWSNLKTSVATKAQEILSDAQAKWGNIKTAITTKTQEIFSNVTGKWQSIRTDVANRIEGMKNDAVAKFQNIVSSAKQKFDDIRNKITSPIESAKTTVLGIIDRIKSAFANMSITIPKPKLPHISVSTKYKSIAGISIPYPDFSVNWYAKGGIFTSPSIIGVGEAGKEAVIPLDRLPGLISDALRQAQPSGGGNVVVQQMIVRNESDIQKIARELYNLQQRASRARGVMA